MIEAELPDGTILEFPDGTDRAVIQSTVKKQLGVVEQQTEPQKETREQTGAEKIGLPGASYIAELTNFGEPVAAREAAKKTVSETGRQLGLTARHALEGVSSVADLPNMAINAVGGNLPLPSQEVSRALTALGIPQPSNATERIVGSASRAASGAITGVGVGRGLSQLLPRTSAILTAEPAVQARAAVGAGAGSQVAQELGGGPVSQTVSGLIGGLGAGAIRSPQKMAKTPQVLSDVEQRGVEGANALSDARKNIISEAKRQQASAKSATSRAEIEGMDAFISLSDARKLSNSLKQKASKEFDEDKIKYYTAAASKIDEKIDSGIVTVNDLQGARRTATQDSQSGGGKGFAGGDVRRSIDDFLGEAEVIRGNPKSIQLWKNAVSKWKNYYETFEDPSAIKSAISDENGIETIEKIMLGGADSVSRADKAAKIYDQALKAAPRAKREETGLKMRQAVINKMLKSSIRKSDSGDTLNVEALSKDIRNLRVDNKSLWGKFSDQERATLKNLEKRLKEETQAGAIARIGEFVTGFVNRALGSKVSIPNVLKPSKVMTLEDVLKASKYIAKEPATDAGKTGAAFGTLLSQEGEQQ